MLNINSTWQCCSSYLKKFKIFLGSCYQSLHLILSNSLNGDETIRQNFYKKVKATGIDDGSSHNDPQRDTLTSVMRATKRAKII